MASVYIYIYSPNIFYYFRSGKNASTINDNKLSSNPAGCETVAVCATGQQVDRVAAERTEGDVQSRCSTEDRTDARLEREHIDNACESGVSTDDENRLVIDCSDTDRGSDDKKCASVRKGRNSATRKVSENDNVCDSRVTRSKARLLYSNQSVDEKLTAFAASGDCEMDSASSCKDASEAVGGSGLGKSLGDVTVRGSFGATESTLCSEVSDSVAVSQADRARSHSVDISTGDGQDCRAGQQRSAQEPSQGEKNKPKREEFNLADSGINVSYRLWKMCKDEVGLEDRKESFLKGECPNREINVLVRCKVDGHRVSW
jgi:hypothetical protein